MKKLLIVLLLIATFCTSTAQTSLEQSTDELIRRADSCKQARDYDTALNLYKDLIEKVSDQRLLELELSAADIFYETADFDTSFLLYQEVNINANKEDQAELKANALHGMAHILWRSGDNVKAMSNIIEGIEIFTQLKDTSNIIRSSNVLAGIYMSLDNLDKAESIYSSMLKMAILTNDSINMAWDNEYLGVLYFYRGDNERSMRFYQNAVNINLRLNRELELGINYSNMGETLIGMEQYEESVESSLKGKKILEKHGFRSALIFTFYTLGRAYTGLGQYQKALEYYNLSLETMWATGETRELQFIYELMAENYAAQGKFKEAFEYHKLHSSAKDSIFNESRVQQMEEIKAKYDIEKEEQKNFFLEREVKDKKAIIRTQYIAGALLIILLLAGVFLSYKLYLNRQLLLQANQTKDKMFGFLAHDLRSPASVIQSLSELISSDTEFEITDEERKVFLNELRSSSVSLVVLLDDLLAWSLTQQRGYNFKPERVQIRELSEQVNSLFGFLLRSKALKVESLIPDDLYAHVDPKALLTIMRNVLSNAIKFTPEKGSISMEASPLQDQVLLKIKDTGIGMTKDQIEGILKTKQFTSTSGTSKEKGSGLGLNMVKDFVKESHGSLNIISEVDKGTCFEIYLPKASA